MVRISLAIALTCLGSTAGCRSTGRDGSMGGGQAILFDGLGDHHRKITTASPQAQRYFDQGLTWAFAFNHDEAIRSFKEAARLDPGCAMAYWGIALCNGPHINNPAMTPKQSAAAWDALQKALELKDKSSRTERALIEALAHRYDLPAPPDRKPFDEAYAEAMGQVWITNRSDADVGALYAEARMDLRPWDLWTHDGKPQPGTEEIIAVLDHVLSTDPDHPGVNHLYIHAVEASPSPSRALAAADRLRNAVPASGHLMHMPSHIDVLTGAWDKAARQNELAIAADRKYRKQVPKQGFYRVYMAHNQHMLAFACMMQGRSKDAIRAAREMVAGVPADYAKENAALVDGYMGAPYDALKRFGRWDEILREPPPPAYLPITTAMWRFNRGVSYAAKGQLAQAEREQLAFKQAVAKVPPDAVMAINPAHKILSIADHMLAGEIAIARKDLDKAIAELTEAVALEDQLAYMEPPEWVQPVRHTLGAVLLSAARYDEADRVYRADLQEWPNNGWSLYGLSKALRAQGRTAEADKIQKQFQAVWAGADIKIDSSCLCVQ